MANLDPTSPIFPCFEQENIVLWMNIEYFAPQYFECVTRLLDMDLISGTEIYVDDFGGTDGLRYLGPTEDTQYMVQIIDLLLDIGFKKRNIFGATYDFRYAPGIVEKILLL